MSPTPHSNLGAKHPGAKHLVGAKRLGHTVLGAKCQGEEMDLRRNDPGPFPIGNYYASLGYKYAYFYATQCSTENPTQTNVFFFFIE